MRKEDARAGRVSTGIAGLDDVLGGGLPPHQLHLIQGDSGAGKTTTALHFLIEGRARGEQGIYVTLSETKEELQIVAASHGWSLDGITIHELAVAEEVGKGDYTLFHPSEVEMSRTTQGVLETVERLRPSRVVFDSLSELRLLARDALRFRRQILALKHFFIGRECTVLLLDDLTGEAADLQLQSLAHSVICFEHMAPGYGADRRRLLVKKMRGVRFRGGYHDFKISTGRLVVFPRLVAAEHHARFDVQRVPSGIDELDQLLGGGLDRGSSTLIAGPAGSGKSTLALRYAMACAERGQHASLFLFEEGLQTLFLRARGFGWDLDSHVNAGIIEIHHIDPAELTPGEFAWRVRQAAERDVTRIVVIDSLNGYLNAMPEEHHLALHLHELLGYLGQRGVASIMVLAQHGIAGAGVHSPVDLSYLADTVVLLRYFESQGHIRQAISVLKRRAGGHERTLREFQLSSRGIRLGPPLREFQGVLTGTPTHSGAPDSLLARDDERSATD
jgi:circadian clock protein KaiC